MNALLNMAFIYIYCRPLLYVEGLICGRGFGGAIEGREKVDWKAVI
jgi:hypothetical protein